MSTDPQETSLITVRAAEPDDYLAVREIYAQPTAIFGTLQMPYPSAEVWRQRLAKPGSPNVSERGQAYIASGFWRTNGE